MPLEREPLQSAASLGVHQATKNLYFKADHRQRFFDAKFRDGQLVTASNNCPALLLVQ